MGEAKQKREDMAYDFRRRTLHANELANIGKPCTCCAGTGDSLYEPDAYCPTCRGTLVVGGDVTFDV